MATTSQLLMMVCSESYETAESSFFRSRILVHTSLGPRDESTLTHDIGVCFDFTAYSEAFGIFDNIEGMQF